MENNEAKESMIMKNIVDLGKFSFAQEEKREENLAKTSTNLLTIFSVIALLISFILPKGNLFLSTTIFVLLCLNSILILFSRWHFKYKKIQDAKEIFDEISKNCSNYESQENFDMHWIHNLSVIQKSKEKINNKRVKFLMISQILFLITVIVLIISEIF